MKTQQNTQHHYSYSCPMHPEVKGKKGDRCPKCGMELQPNHQQDSSDLQVHLTTAPQKIELGKPTKIILNIQQDGKTVSLDETHEKKMHLMIVSEDLKWFRHIHPEEQSDGSFSIEETFPHGGRYHLFVDHKPSRSGSSLTRLNLNVDGKPASNESETSEKLVSNVDGYKVTLENGHSFKTNRNQPLNISLEKEGIKVSENNLEQYLGANAHIVMIGKADKEYLHIHPITNISYPIYAETFIENTGIYRVWVQFQTNGQVHTADFTVNVEQGEEIHNHYSKNGHPNH